MKNLILILSFLIAFLFGACSETPKGVSMNDIAGDYTEACSTTFEVSDDHEVDMSYFGNIVMDANGSWSANTDSIELKDFDAMKFNTMSASGVWYTYEGPEGSSIRWIMKECKGSFSVRGETMDVDTNWFAANAPEALDPEDALITELTDSGFKTLDSEGIETTYVVR